MDSTKKLYQSPRIEEIKTVSDGCLLNASTYLESPSEEIIEWEWDLEMY